MNRNNRWTSREDNLARLAHQLDVQDGVQFSPAEIVDFLEHYEGITQSYMALVAFRLKDAIEKAIHINAGRVSVTFEEDASWNGR